MYSNSMLVGELMVSIREMGCVAHAVRMLLSNQAITVELKYVNKISK